jgi:hypothetical protein
LSILAIFLAVIVSLPPSLLKGMAARDISIALVCGADPVLVKMVAGMAADYDLIRRISIEDDEKAAEVGLENGKFDVLIVLPDDVEQALYYGEPVIVRVKAKDPLLGTLVYQLSNATIETINSVEYLTGYVYEKNQALGMASDENGDRYYRFVNQVFLDAIVRFSYVEDVAVSKPYDTQAVSLVQFSVTAVSAVFIAVVSAGQIADGYLRRLAARGYPVWKLIAVKLVNAIILALLLSVFALVGFHQINMKCDPFKYFFAAALLSAILTSMCLSALTFGVCRAAAVSRSLLNCTAILLMLLFWGGGFYPVYLMKISFRSLNPAWLSHLLADWSFSGLFPAVGAFALFLLPLAVCLGVAHRRFRRSLCR